MPRVIQRALVFGARGQIGRFLLPRLRQEGVAVEAVTRGSLPVTDSGVRWHHGELFAGGDLALEVDAIFSLGPLDGFCAWLQRSAKRPAVVVAFGSTSASTKRDSDDAGERALAQRLVATETALLALCAARGSAVTVLRPTLIYGAGIDRSLSRLARIARRFGSLPLPRDANGMRQPVHAADLAEAALAAARRDGLLQPRYDLPGGETLPYREMVQRVLACLSPPARVVAVPATLARMALGVAHAFGLVRDANTQMLARMHRDLVFDGSDARRDLGFEPRRFEPTALMFGDTGSR